MNREIKQHVTIDASPKAVFEALMDQRRHREFTGEPAKISRQPGDAFRCYGEYIDGINVAVTAPGLIIQAWRSRNWPENHYSLVTFKLAALAGGKTKLTFTQIGVPAWDYSEKNKGWRTHYWEPLKKYLAAQK